MVPAKPPTRRVDQLDAAMHGSDEQHQELPVVLQEDQYPELDSQYHAGVAEVISHVDDSVPEPELQLSVPEIFKELPFKTIDTVASPL